MVTLCAVCNFAYADSDKLNSIDEVILKFSEITTKFRKVNQLMSVLEFVCLELSVKSAICSIFEIILIDSRAYK